MHFILLLSAKDDQAATRTFRDFLSKDELAQAIIVHFEAWKTAQERNMLAKNNIPLVLNDCLEYTSDELWEWMEQFYGELVCLVKEENGLGDLWVPQTIEWIKETIQIYLRTQYSRKLEFLNKNSNGASSSQVTHMEV